MHWFVQDVQVGKTVCVCIFLDGICKIFFVNNRLTPQELQYLPGREQQECIRDLVLEHAP